jgi:hypothetical protein
MGAAVDGIRISRGSILVAPVGQLSTAATVEVAGARLDASHLGSVSYTCKVATNAVTWQVTGANLADYSDEVVVNGPVSVGAGAVGTYAVAQAVYQFYRVSIIDTVGGTHGTATVTGHAKG